MKYDAEEYRLLYEDTLERKSPDWVSRELLNQSVRGDDNEDS